MFALLDDAEEILAKYRGEFHILVSKSGSEVDELLRDGYIYQPNIPIDLSVLQLGAELEQQEVQQVSRTKLYRIGYEADRIRESSKSGIQDLRFKRLQRTIDTTQYDLNKKLNQLSRLEVLISDQLYRYVHSDGLFRIGKDGRIYFRCYTEEELNELSSGRGSF